MRDRGQNIIELAIIIAIVGLGGIFTLTLLGGNINEMFSKTNDEVKEYDPFQTIAASTSSASTPTSPSGPSQNVNVNGNEVTYNSDGSASFTVGGQNIAMNTDVMNSLNTVFETSGSDGMTSEVMAAIEKLIAAHEGNYAEGQMPLSVRFGTVSKEKNNQSYLGNAEANFITLTVGEDMIIINKDQEYIKDGVKQGCDSPEATCSVSTLEGKIDGSGKFIGQATTGSDILSMDFGIDGDGNIEGQLGNGWSWDINFNDLGQSIKM